MTDVPVTPVVVPTVVVTPGNEAAAPTLLTYAQSVQMSEAALAAYAAALA